MNKTLFYSVMIGFILAVSVTAAKAQVDLNGTWRGDDNATYYIRHIIKTNVINAKDEVWWFGQGKNFGNVFHGSITDGKLDEISGQWVDVPIGAAKNNGSIKIIIDSADRLILLGEPGNFKVREWKRIKLAGISPGSIGKPSF